MVFAPLVVCCRAGTLDLLLLLEGRVSEICAYYDLLCCICLFFLFQVRHNSECGVKYQANISDFPLKSLVATDLILTFAYNLLSNS